MEDNKINIQNNDNNISQNENGLVNEKKCNLYCILTIDKNNYDKDQMKLSISNIFVHSQNTKLINLQETNYKKSDGNSEIKIIKMLYMISFIPKDRKSPKQRITLNLRIKNGLRDINSYILSFKNKDYIFIYEHSLEDISRNHRNKISLNIFQQELNLYSKFFYFNHYLCLLLKTLLLKYKKEKFIFLLFWNFLKWLIKRVHIFILF